MIRNLSVVLSVFFLIFCSDTSRAQRVTIFGKAPVRLEGEGLLISKMKEREFLDDIGNCPREKVVPVYLGGSWISIRTTDSPYGSSVSISEHNRKDDILYLGHYQSHKLYSRLFFTKTPIAGQTQVLHADSLKKINHKVLLTDNVEIAYSFLRVNDFFFVDFLDYRTDTLVRRYYIKRLRTAPVITGFRQESENGGTLDPFIERPHNQGTIQLSPEKKVSFTLSRSAELPDSLLRYDLINFTTGDTIHYVGARGIEIYRPAAGTQYSLQLYYSAQPETLTVLHLTVRPYWYRSPVFYVIAGILFFLMLLVVTITFMRRKIQSSENKQSETEQYLRAVQSQLNPHFAFNALGSIQGLINTGRIPEANHYLQEFSVLLRKTLERSQHVFNTMDREIDMMKTYIGLEELRFNFSWEISVSPGLLMSEIEIPTLLIQPLIENAIKHGISPLGPAGQLFVHCTEGINPDSFMIMVKDNGNGFDSSESGYGLKLTKDRIGAVNKLYKEKSIELLFGKNSGMEVTLLFHNWTTQ